MLTSRNRDVQRLISPHRRCSTIILRFSFDSSRERHGCTEKLSAELSRSVNWAGRIRKAGRRSVPLSSVPRYLHVLFGPARPTARRLAYPRCRSTSFLFVHHLHVFFLVECPPVIFGGSGALKAPGPIRQSPRLLRVRSVTGKAPKS